MAVKKTYPSRYEYGVTTIQHKGVDVTTSINSKIEDFIKDIPDNIEYQTGRSLPFVEHRPDSIADIFYSKSHLWWYVMLFNNINDPFEGFNSGDRLLIPDENYLIDKK